MMSPLLNATYEDFIKIDKKSVSDGEGGFYTTYVDGALFSAALTVDNVTLNNIGEVLREKVTYTVLTKRKLDLEQDDLIKRVSDNQVFRVFFENKSNETPSISALDLRETKAEKWSISI